MCSLPGRSRSEPWPLRTCPDIGDLLPVVYYTDLQLIWDLLNLKIKNGGDNLGFYNVCYLNIYETTLTA